MQVLDVVGLDDQERRVLWEREPVADEPDVRRLAVEEGRRAALSVRAVVGLMALRDVEQHRPGPPLGTLTGPGDRSVGGRCCGAAGARRKVCRVGGSGSLSGPGSPESARSDRRTVRSTA